MLNNAVIMGRLVADPELRTTGSGISVSSFTVAVDRRFTRQGEDRQADFIDIIAWRQTAEFVCKYFRKGSSLCIAGQIQTRTWTDSANQKRYAGDPDKLLVGGIGHFRKLLGLLQQILAPVGEGAADGDFLAGGLVDGGAGGDELTFVQGIGHGLARPGHGVRGGGLDSHILGLIEVEDHGPGGGGDEDGTGGGVRIHPVVVQRVDGRLEFLTERHHAHHGEHIAVDAVEALGHIPAQLQMLLLILAHWNEICVHHENVRSHQYGVGKKTVRRIEAVRHLVLVAVAALEKAHGSKA